MESYEIIKKLRIQANMSQDELAQKTGYTDRSSIAKIEAGKVDLTESKIVLFSKAFDVSPAYIMGLIDEEKPATDKSDELDEKAIEILNLFSALPPTKQKEAMNYLRYLLYYADSE